MYLFYVLQAPPNTPPTAPVDRNVKLSRGVLEYVDIGFSRWNARLGKCRILYNSLQIVPFNLDEWMTGNDATIRVDTHVELAEEPYMITLQVINDDDTFAHAISFGLYVDTGMMRSTDEILAMQGLLQIKDW